MDEVEVGLLTVSEVARLLRLSVAAVYALCRSNQLVHHRLGSGRSAIRIRRCGQCDLWFELGPQAGRANRLFCSGGCRTRAHRARREKAWELHRQGKGPKEIAEATATVLATVKKWLRQAKG
jgi:excisionase family DNA binding protein